MTTPRKSPFKEVATPQAKPASTAEEPAAEEAGPSSDPSAEPAASPTVPAKLDPRAAAKDLPPERGGYQGPEPTRYGDWEHKGRVTDF